MKKRFRLTYVFTLLAFLAGCAGLPPLLSTPEPASVSTATSTSQAAATNLPTTQPTPGGARILRLWVPPQFDPAAETPAAALLQARLDEFAARRPGLQVEVRVKAASGTNGLLESLAATDAAAPVIMPDLALLSRADLEAAALRGLLHPLDGLTTVLDDPDWYPYAHQLARIQNTSFGLPVAGDALVLAGYADPLPADWEALEDKTFLFPAADPQAFFSLALYLSAGASLVDAQGQPRLDESAMAEVLSLYARSVAAENLSSTVLSYQDDAAAWDALKQQRANLGMVWTSSYLVERPASVSLAVLPGLEGDAITLARGYVWALAGSEPEKQALAVELAEFLSASEFLAEWSEAAGVLPTRPTALSSWEDAALRVVLGEVSESAQLLPGSDLLALVGPSFQQAVEAVLSGEALPTEAAHAAAEQFK
ncbi:MAG: extracellular solute-binding protein [Chloroflexota bacterium]